MARMWTDATEIVEIHERVGEALGGLIENQRPFHLHRRVS